MKTSQKGIDLIKLFEGFSSKAYICPANYLTIGYGHVISDSDPLLGASLTEQEGHELLQRDLLRFERGVSSLIKVPLTQNQFDALVSFAYNLGVNSLQVSTLRMRLNRKEYFDASIEFLRWNKARVNGVLLPLKGLTKRRQAERKLFLS